MGVKLIGGLVGLVVIVVLLQSLLFGGGDDSPSTPGRSGAIPTATLPAQLPNPIVLGESAGSDVTGGSSAADSYVVQAGDTLGAIAAKLGVAGGDQAAWTAQVLQINAIPDPRQIQVGQTLQLPATAKTAQATATRAPSTSPTATPTSASAGRGTPSPTATRQPASDGSGDSYTVVAGDTPLGIAEKFCVDGAVAWANELVTLNGIDAGNLNIGDVLELPANTPAQCG